jgi:16S rRNA (uracil1498-N3)-methyltransferase
MRALYLPESKLSENSSVVIEGDALHHMQVVRIKNSDEILLLDGAGTKANALVVEIQKKYAVLLVKKVERAQRPHHYCLAIGVPKKDAFEDIIKMATELGVNEIYPLSSDFSQYEYNPNERFEKILESALVQSNNLFKPIIHSQVPLEQFLNSYSAEILFLNSRQNIGTSIRPVVATTCALVGPEGGFSASEEEKILSMTNVKSIHLKTPILRAPTAVATAIGYLLAGADFN